MQQQNASITGDKLSINIEDLATGVYWLNITSSNEATYTAKFIKE